jgi:transposase
LRELIFIDEQYDQNWAQDMIDLLLKIKLVVDEAKPTTDCLVQKIIQSFEREYQRILDDGFKANPPPDISKLPKKRGRQNQNKAKNLLELNGIYE